MIEITTITCYLFLSISYIFFHWSHQVILSVSRNWYWKLSVCNVKHIMTLQMETITLVLKISIYIITNITTHPIILPVILVMMSVSTFITDGILYTCTCILLQSFYYGIYISCFYLLTGDDSSSKHGGKRHAITQWS